MFFGVDEYDFKLYGNSHFEVQIFLFDGVRHIADRRADRRSTGTCSGTTFHGTVGKDAFPWKFNTFLLPQAFHRVNRCLLEL